MNELLLTKQMRWSYLAGLLDGDGCFTLSLNLTRVKNPSITISPQVSIGLKENDSSFLIKFCQELKLGKIYFSNKGKPHGKCTWQTTNITDAIKFCEGVISYLEIKKAKAEKFLTIAKFWRDTMPAFRGKRINGKRLRTRSQIKIAVKTALEINYDRQTVRYREKKGWDYWNDMIDKLYQKENEV